MDSDESQDMMFDLSTRFRVVSYSGFNNGFSMALSRTLLRKEASPPYGMTDCPRNKHGNVQKDANTHISIKSITSLSFFGGSECTDRFRVFRIVTTGSESHSEE